MAIQSEPYPLPVADLERVIARVMAIQSEQPRIMRVNEVMRQTGLPRSSLYNLISKGDFPRPKQLSDSAVGWLAEEVWDWVGSRQTVR